MSPDGKTAYIGMQERGVFVWDTARDKLSMKMESDRRDCAGLTISPDGKFLAGSISDGQGNRTTIRIWEVLTGKIHRTVDTKGLNLHGRLVFADGGATLAGVVRVTLPVLTDP